MSVPSLLAQSESPGIADNKVLDQWRVPFGDWVEQMVRWVDLNLEWLLDIVRWPFSFLFRNFVDGPGHQPWWQITDMPWVAVCLLFFAVGTFFRNVKVGGFVAGLLALCGLLGGEYWEETALTVGMIVVAVVLCAVIGIPVGILCGRSDGVWNAVRPVLDAMQVVHPFVYMLPIVFFFSIGLTPATMVTMVFALPPLIRLTNLGIRQVPEDVVEASRAYGAPEWRVLADVQLPLARPAVMTGLNQTLLLSISMLGIAAIMGAGGLGLLVFRAIRNLDIEGGASSGLALYVVAVVLDRISQSEDSDPENLFTRVRRAWAHRQNPEALLPEAAVIGTVAKTRGQPASLSMKERRSLTIAAAGAIIAVIAVFLPWGYDSGKISGHQRLVDTGRWEYVEIDPAGSPGEFEFRAASDNPPAEHAAAVERLENQRIAVLAAAGSEGLAEDEAAAEADAIGEEIARLSNPLAGRGFNGLSASGGSFYGIAVFGFALLIIAAVVTNLRRPGGGMRLFGSNGVFVMAVGSLTAAVAYLWSAPGPSNIAYSDGIGPWIAVVGGAVAAIGAVFWLRQAPYSALTPLPAGVSRGKLGVAVLVLALAVVSGFSGWSFDSRSGAGIIPDPAVEAQIEALRQQARDDPDMANVVAQEISAISNAARRTGTVVVDGFVGDGSKYGYLAIGLAVVGFGFALPAAGVFGSDERRRRRWSTAVACVGVALMVVATVWIASLLRVADPQVTSGAGAFICLVAGFLLMASTSGVLTKFSRSQVYVSVDEPEVAPEASLTAPV
ncbi:ABC transporter permease [Candidatus Poriferisocius sp.]|uniref:ABC transporter permease n=1 Tax=Candidatus Poriferisocius sp. TaxID=3101276 RepID=UPI003B012323